MTNWKHTGKWLIADIIASWVAGLAAPMILIAASVLWQCTQTACPALHPVKTLSFLIHLPRFAIRGLYIGAFLLPLLLISLPARIVMHDQKLNGFFWQTLPTVVAFSLLIGWFFNMIFHALDDGTESVGRYQDYLIYLYAAVVGLVAATVAWLIRRPDLDNKASGTPPLFKTIKPRHRSHLA